MKLKEEAENKKASDNLFIKAVTWHKDSHSLFDYESTKITTINFTFPIAQKSVTFYRKRDSQQIMVREDDIDKCDQEDYQMLTRFQMEPSLDEHSKVKLHFTSQKKPEIKEPESDRVNTNESVESFVPKEEETYMIIRKLKDLNGEPRGYKLQSGQTIKLGRVEFYVSEILTNGALSIAPSKNKEKVYACRKVMKFDPSDVPESKQKRQCKICLEETETGKNYMINPCRCAGSCGSVHIQCMMEWIHFKVKKEVVGGTLHYNFEKFECEVCKLELPMIIDINGEMTEMLPIEKPEGNYMILEGACEKSKSVMVIQNIAPDGIKLGRGHECEIRITDISVSRSHAIIRNHNGGFYIFDNKSKFGSLVREEDMTINLGRQSNGVQIGRTVLTLEVRNKQKEAKE